MHRNHRRLEIEGAKVSLVLHCTFANINHMGKKSGENENHFHPGNHIITKSMDLVEVLWKMELKIEEKIPHWTSKKTD